MPPETHPAAHSEVILKLQHLLEDPTIEEIWINSPEAVFVARNGVTEQIRIQTTADEIAIWIERLMAHSQRRLDRSSPFVDATLQDGSRLHVAIPDVVEKHWAINIRRFIKRMNTLPALEAAGVINQEIALLLEAAVLSGYNIIVSGGTGAGKTTMVNSLLAVVPSSIRIITCEEVRELEVKQPDHVALQTKPANLEGSGAVDLRELIKQSLRMRPERLVVGEVRGAEAFDMLLAFNSGQPGFATIHANSAAEAISKLTALPLLAGRNVTRDFVVPAVASAVDLIVQVQRDHTGNRHVVEIVATTGEVQNGAVEFYPLIVRERNSWRICSSKLSKSEVRHGVVDAAALWAAISIPLRTQVA